MLDDRWEFENWYALQTGEANDATPWYDEWICPRCRNGCYMDWPKARIEDLKTRAEAGENLFDQLRSDTSRLPVTVSIPPEILAQLRAQQDREEEAYKVWLAMRWTAPEKQ